jgi:hypothetical protein
MDKGTLMVWTKSRPGKFPSLPRVVNFPHRRATRNALSGNTAAGFRQDTLVCPAFLAETTVDGVVRLPLALRSEEEVEEFPSDKGREVRRA